MNKSEGLGYVANVEWLGASFDVSGKNEAAASAIAEEFPTPF
jgi:hypothetical protein